MLIINNPVLKVKVSLIWRMFPISKINLGCSCIIDGLFAINQAIIKYENKIFSDCESHGSVRGAD